MPKTVMERKNIVDLYYQCLIRSQLKGLWPLIPSKREHVKGACLITYTHFAVNLLPGCIL